MRVFTCREGEALVINHEITVYIVEVTDDEICLKIDYPPGVRIHAGDTVEHEGAAAL
jgi:sRNA-binding carbon storage regulator CsrA